MTNKTQSQIKPKEGILIFSKGMADYKVGYGEIIIKTDDINSLMRYLKEKHILKPAIEDTYFSSGRPEPNDEYHPTDAEVGVGLREAVRSGEHFSTNVESVVNSPGLMNTFCVSQNLWGEHKYRVGIVGDLGAYRTPGKPVMGDSTRDLAERMELL